MDLVLVDGPNVFNSVARFLETAVGDTHRELLPQYFLDWFDFDRLVLKAIGTSSPPTLGIVLFHSNRALGRGAARLDGNATRAFWARQAGNFDTSDMIVDVPADQREVYEFSCTSCAAPNNCTVSGEKGVDSAMIVHMFETAHRWESLAIFSRDVDFAPAVIALRRRGKQVYAVGEPGDAQSALSRAAQSFFTLPLTELLQDFALFVLCRPGGVLDAWRAAVEQSGMYRSGYFWGPGDVLIAHLKGETPEPLVRQLKATVERIPGIGIRGDVSHSPGQAGLAVYIPLFFRRVAPLGKWSEATVDDLRQIPDPVAK